MKQYMKNLLLILVSLFFQFAVIGQTASNLWQAVNIPTKHGDPLNVNGLVVNDRGVILAVGYTKEAVNYKDLFPTRLYKMFRSTNNGQTWEDISKPEVQQKLNRIDYTQLDNIDQYTDQVSVVGNRFYIDFSWGNATAGYQGDGHFYSDDDGKTWTLVSDEAIFQGNRTFFLKTT